MRYLTRIYGVERRASDGGGPGGAVYRWALHHAGDAKRPAGLRVVIEKKAAALAAVEWLVERRRERCGVRRGQTTVAELERMRKALPGKVRRSFFAACSTDWLRGCAKRRMRTRSGGMRRAAKVGCGLFDVALERAAGRRQRNGRGGAMELAARRAGADGMSFETIVASGKRSALPHGRATLARAAAARICDAGFWRAAGWVLLGHDAHRAPGQSDQTGAGRVSFCA